MVLRRSLAASLSLHAIALASVAWLSFGAPVSLRPRHPGLEVGFHEPRHAEPARPPERLPEPELPDFEEPTPPRVEETLETRVEEPAARPRHDPLADTWSVERKLRASFRSPRPNPETAETPVAEAAPAPPAAPAPATAASAASVSAVLLDAPPPAYPRASLRLGEEGSVRLSIEVAVDGRVRAVRILESSGHARLDRAATEAVLRWRFSPALEGSLPAPAVVVHRVTFRLTDAG